MGAYGSAQIAINPFMQAVTETVTTDLWVGLSLEVLGTEGSGVGECVSPVTSFTALMFYTISTSDWYRLGIHPTSTTYNHHSLLNEQLTNSQHPIEHNPSRSHKHDFW